MCAQGISVLIASTNMHCVLKVLRVLIASTDMQCVLKVLVF